VKRSKAATPDEREKVWQRLLSTSASFEVKSIKIIESDVFISQTIDLRRVLAFIGLHGTGKSLLLRMIEAAFGYVSQISAPPFTTRDAGRTVIGERKFQIEPEGVKAILEIELKASEDVIVRRVDLSESEESRRQIWTEVLGDSFSAWCASPLYAFAELAVIFQDYYFIRQYAESEAGRDLKSANLKAIANILGRSYDRLTVRPAYFDPESKSGAYVPYITASLGGQVLESSMMSQGELWTHYVLNWFLENDVKKGHLALLDEPEAFLAARAQRPFIDEVARQALSKSSQVIIATHSPEVLARFPLDNIRMCIASNEGIRIVKPSSTVEMRECIGIETPIRMLVLVEDELSREILQILFARYDRALARETEIVPVDGAGEVKNGLRILKHIDKLSCVGVFDADERAKAIVAERPAFFLPGASFPEDELLSAVSRETTWIAARINVTADDLMVAASTCRGSDHQYWLKKFATRLGLSEAAVIYELVQAWMRDKKIAAGAERLVKNIRSEFPSYG
jgi:hypothetical protein